MKAKLVIRNISSQEAPMEKVIPPELDILTIGRHPSSNIYLASSHISKEHALIVREGGSFFIIDKSSNGTLINQARIEKNSRVLLQTGQVIALGEFQLTFISEPEPVSVSTKTSVAEVSPVQAPQPRPPQPKPPLPPQPKDPNSEQGGTMVLPDQAKPKKPATGAFNFIKEPTTNSTDTDFGDPLNTFIPSSFEEVIRGLDPGDEASYLVFVGGNKDGQRVELRGSTSEIFVGKGANCQVQIQHPSIGATHAKIRMDWAGITVYDLNSQTGVFINGVRINSSRKLHNGDEISFGVPVSMGGVKLILYDRNSLSSDSWVGLPPPIKNEKAAENPAEVAASASEPASKDAGKADSNKKTEGNKETEKPKDNQKEAEKEVPAVEEPVVKKGLSAVVDLNKVLYAGITIKDVLFMVAGLAFIGLFLAVAISFL